ncbi:hypothetical protein BGX21_007067, partial [Mortierella sp. AD011]
YYHHCANVIIKGQKHGKLPTLDMTVVDVTQKHEKRNVHAKGDGKDSKSSGPMSSEVKLNKSGAFAYGGKLKNKGLKLGLVTIK